MVVVNAAGVWAGQVDPGIKLRTSRGIHLVIPVDRLGNSTRVLTVPLLASVSWFVFAMPEQLGRVYLGLTDVPDVPKEDEEFLLAVFNRALATDLTETDVVGASGHCESQGKTTADHTGLPESLIARFGLEACTVVDCATIARPLDADDVVDRRTRIGLVPVDREEAFAEVAAIVAEVS